VQPDYPSLDATLTSVLAGFGLAGASGLNAWLPAFAAAFLTRLGWVELGEPFDQLTGTVELIVLGTLMTADFVGDKVPAVDHVLHSAGAVIAPLSGTVMFNAELSSATDSSYLVSALCGGTTAGAVHAARAAIRPISTVTTLGVGNPVLSLLEDAGSATLIVFAFVVPLLAVLAVIGLLAGGVVVWRRRRRRRSA
jgi:Domain of unknown function (DUF4126)